MPNLTSVKGISNSFEITFVSTAQRQAIFFEPTGISLIKGSGFEMGFVLFSKLGIFPKL